MSAPYRTIISPEELGAHLGKPGWVVVDCRFNLADTEAGQRAYREGHVPGAVYAHLDEDLSGPVIRGQTGRHPLPEPSTLARRLGEWGIDSSTQVVVYDSSGGSTAGRLWWMLRWLGHDRVALLDGGWQAWVAGGHPVSREVPRPERRVFSARLRPELALDAAAVARIREDRGWRLLDARSAERFHGQNETIDPVAGHIPGAVSAPFAENLGADGRFKPAEELRRRYAALIGSTPPDRVVCYCGSGVTAVHNIIALEHAGLGEARLYPGSWSEWIADPARPTVKD